MIVIGIDPHKSSHTASALDVGTHQLTDRLRIEASLTEYRRLLAWAKGSTSDSGRCRTPRAWATTSPGPPPRAVAARPRRDRGGCPGHPTARVRELSRGRRKTDTLDAAAAASVAALHGDARPVPAEGSATVLGMLDEHRTNLTRQRTRTVNQLHALMRELLPGGAPTT